MSLSICIYSRVMFNGHPNPPPQGEGLGRGDTIQFKVAKSFICPYPKFKLVTKTIHYLLALLLTLTLASCAGKPSRPDWIAGKSADYPAKQYLVGRGQADNSATARDRARADLAKIFQVTLKEQSEDIITHSQQNNGMQQQSETSARITRAIATQTNQIVEGIRIAEQWQDPKSNTYHVLAVLNRSQAGIRLRERISQLDNATDNYIQSARNRSNLITKIGAATRALDTQLERTAYQKLLQIIDRIGTGVPFIYNPAKLRNHRDELLKRLHITPRINHDAIGGLDEILSGALSSAGFTHQPGQTANFLLDAELQLTKITDAEGWHWLRGALMISLLDPSNNSVLGSHRWDIKVSAQKAAIAEKRARNKIDQLLKQQLKRVIIGFGQPK